MKIKTIVSAVFLGLFISGNTYSQPLTVSAKSTDSIGYKRVIGFQSDDRSIVGAMHLIKKTGAFRVIKGDCHITKMTLKQQVLCISEFKNNVVVELGGKTVELGKGMGEESLADAIYKIADNSQISPISTKLAYVGKTDNGMYRLYHSNFDGSNEELLIQSDMPILSPSFSRDGRYIAYVSFERVRSGIYIYDTHRRQKIKAVEVRGLNGYPSFKNNHTLLISMSKEQVNSDIYEFDILSKEFKQLTKSSEPELYPKYMNGELYYVKMFGDTPYLYKQSSGKEKKVFNTPHNTPSVSEATNSVLAIHGSELVLERNGNYKVIYRNDSIESPTIDKSGQLLYATIEINGESVILGLNKYGEAAFKLKKKNENIIQVVAN